MSVRVLVADDDHLMRAGLIELLGADPTITVIGHAASGHMATELEAHLEPDVVLMDIQMPDGDGIAATRHITARPGAARVLMLTTFDNDEYLFGALEAGAAGFILKRARPEDLIAAVHCVSAGDAVLGPEVTRRVIDRIGLRPNAHADITAVASLTPRERDVFDLITVGLSNREIAERLYVEESTIRTHVKRVLAKLELPSRIQAIIYAYENNLVLPTHGQPR
jgi:DNA-binding NarL/FixJ family response regulator